MSSHGRSAAASAASRSRSGRAAGHGERGAAPALDGGGEAGGDLGGGARGGIVVDDHRQGWHVAIMPIDASACTRSTAAGSGIAGDGVLGDHDHDADDERTAGCARRGVIPLGRAGIAARGVLYLVLGFLAIQFARGEVGSEQVNQTGAFETVAEQPFGKFLLVALIARPGGDDAVAADPDVRRRPRRGRRGQGPRRVLRARRSSTAFLTVHGGEDHDRQLVRPAGSTTAAQNAGDDQQQQATSTLFDLPAGRLDRRRHRRRADRHRRCTRCTSTS